MEFCFVPSESGPSPRLVRAFGDVVEIAFVRPDYCQAKGGCSRFPGGNTDYFDDNFSGGRCGALSAFLERNNPRLPVDIIKDQCEADKPDPGGRFLIPDIITHDPDAGKLEFYELKPNSDASIPDGIAKVLFFEALCGTHQLPYQPGIDYGGFRKLIWDGTWLGVPVKGFLEVSRHRSGLLVYEICIESNSRFLTEAVAKALIKFLVAALIVLLTSGGGVVVAAPVLILAGSVGEGGANDPRDVAFVQNLLADWRVRNGRTEISVDGEANAETIDAIRDFQNEILGTAEGVMEPDGDGIAQLEALHLATLPEQPGTDWLEATEGLAEFQAAVSGDEELAMARESELPDAAQDYLTQLYDESGRRRLQRPPETNGYSQRK